MPSIRNESTPVNDDVKNQDAATGDHQGKNGPSGSEWSVIMRMVALPQALIDPPPRKES